MRISPAKVNTQAKKGGLGATSTVATRFLENAYVPVTLIFTAPADGEYSVFIGFEGGYDEALERMGGTNNWNIPVWWDVE